MRWDDVVPAVQQLMVEQQLPADFLNVCKTFYFPLAHYLLTKKQALARPLIIGINGAQGTGKSTLAALLQCMLERGAHWRCANLSIDDLYLTRAQRNQLGLSVHPLLKTRGAPGTHDVQLGVSLINDLLHAQTSRAVALPRFDKARDDRKPVEEWSQQAVPVDIIILEGWCVGAVAQPASQLATPVNGLEATEDCEGQWRRYVNQQLAEHYQPLFDQFDFLIMLKAPSMEAVEEWRWLQEQKLIAKSHGTGQGLMTQAQVKRFIQHYERLTRYILEEMPGRADLVFHLNDNHHIEKATGSLTTGMRL